ncbi:MAG: SMC-Scp complex subunit ScpB [Oscillospiraceae bacterium]|nr:SMC-Scp complex subunit ScpB [Oscillospiraceae bacterium]
MSASTGPDPRHCGLDPQSRQGDASESIMDATGQERFDAVAEAILFASGEPLTLERIAMIFERPAPEVKLLLDRMGEGLRRSGRGLLLREIAGKYQLCTRPELAFYVNKLFEIRQKQSLSQAAYETLSIIAYNAGVTRAGIEKIRGVNSDSSIAKLLERGLIVEAGRASLPGRPMRYDVTDSFYKLFGFRSRDDLPDMSDGGSSGGVGGNGGEGDSGDDSNE